MMKVSNDINWKIINKILNNQTLQQRNKLVTNSDEFMVRGVEESYGERYGKSDWKDEWSS